MSFDPQAATLEQEAGVALLNMAQHLWDLVPHRSETVEIIDHARALRKVTVQVDLHSFAGEATERWPPWEDLPDATIPPQLRRTLVRWRGRILVPLTLLQRDSDESPSVTNEANEIVPRLPENEVRIFLRSGLTAIARTALGRERIDPDLFKYLWETDAPSYRKISEFLQGQTLIVDDGFRTALRYATGYRYLIIPVNPDRGSRRVCTYEYVQSINEVGSQPDDQVNVGRGWVRNHVGGLSGLLDRFAESGETPVTIPLGDISDCQRYELEIQAPYDTLFDSASMALQLDREDDVRPQPCDCSHRTKIRFGTDNDPTPKTGILTAQLFAQRTGVIRSSVLSAPFTLWVLLLGTIYASFVPGHTVGRDAEDASVALLLLFAGVIGGVLAAPGRHPVTATLQFPTRLILWLIGVAAYFPAVAVALGVRGRPALAVWIASTAVCAMATWQLITQWRRLKPTAASTTTR